MATYVEIAGVPLVLEAEEEWLATAFHDVVTVERLRHPVGAPAPDLRVELRRGTRAVPPCVPDDEENGVELWSGPEGPIARCRGVVLEVTAATVRAFVPDRTAAPGLPALVDIGLCWLLASAGRYLLHAAAVGVEAEALLVLGHSGSGKSTTVFAALDAGWWALSDDHVALEPSAGGLLAHGVHHALAAPVEIGGELIARSELVDDLRRRGRIEPDVLSTGPRRIAGVVVIGHSTRVAGEVVPLAGHQVMPLVMQSFAASSDRHHTGDFVRVAGALSRLPAWSVGHSSVPALRRDVVVANLRRCLDEGSSGLSAEKRSQLGAPLDVHER